MRIFGRYSFRGQSAIEASVLISCAILALVALQFYFRRSLAGGLHRASTDISEKHFDLHGTNGRSNVDYRNSSNITVGFGIDKNTLGVTYGKQVEDADSAGKQVNQNGGETLDQLGAITQ